MPNNNQNSEKSERTMEQETQIVCRKLKKRIPHNYKPVGINLVKKLCDKLEVNKSDVLKRTSYFKSVLQRERKSYKHLYYFATCLCSFYCDEIGILDLLFLSEILGISMEFKEDFTFLNIFLKNEYNRILHIKVADNNVAIEAINCKEKTVIDISKNILIILEKKIKSLKFLGFFVVEKFNFEKVWKTLKFNIKENSSINSNGKCKIVLKNRNLPRLSNPVKKYSDCKNNLNLDSFVDIDGISFSIKPNEYSRFLKNGLTLILSENSFSKIISKTEKFFYKKGFYNIVDSFYFNVGFINTSVGILNVFLVIPTAKNSLIERKRFFNSLISFFNKEFLNNERKKKSFLLNNIAGKIKRKNEDEKVVKIEVELDLESSNDFFGLMAADNFWRKTKFFLYFEVFGTKNVTISNNILTLYQKLFQSINISGLFNFKIDLCRSFRISSKKDNFVATSLEYSSLRSFGKNIFQIFLNERISNINEKKLKLANDVLSISSFGFFKINIYASIITNILKPHLLKTKFPERTMYEILKDFYGFRLYDGKNKSDLSGKLNKILNSLNDLPDCDYPIRMEANILGNFGFEFDDISKKFIQPEKLCFIDVSEFKEIVFKILGDLIVTTKSLGKNIISNYLKLGCEVFFLEFVLKGGRNLTYISNLHYDFLKKVKFNDLILNNNYFNFIIDKIRGEVTVLVAADHLKKLVNSNKKLGEVFKKTITETISLISEKNDEIIRKIFLRFINDVEKNFKIAEIHNVESGIVQEGVFYDFESYVDSIIPSTWNTSKWVYSIFVNFVLIEGLICGREIKEGFVRNLKLKNIRNLPVLEAFNNLKIKKFGVLVDFNGRERRKQSLMDLLDEELKSCEVLKKNRKPNFSEIEKARLFYGLQEYQNLEDLIKDFRYCFFLTRSEYNLKECLKSMNKKGVHGIAELNLGNIIVDVNKLTINEHFQHIESFGFKLTNRFKKIYADVLILDLESKGVIFDRLNFEYLEEDLIQDNYFSESEFFNNVQEFEDENNNSESEKMCCVVQKREKKNRSNIIVSMHGNLNVIVEEPSEDENCDSFVYKTITAVDTIQEPVLALQTTELSSLEKNWFQKIQKKFGNEKINKVTARRILFCSKYRPSKHCWDVFFEKLVDLLIVKRTGEGYMIV